MLRFVFTCLFFASSFASVSLGAETSPWKVVVENGVVTFSYNQQVLTQYVAQGEKLAKPYFWPVLTPSGVPVTRAWPMKTGYPKETTDHIHQKSIWFCHGDVIPNEPELKEKSLIKGVEGVDFWSEAPGHGRIVCTEIGKPEIKENTAKILTKNEWRSASGLVILQENRTISVTMLGSALRIDLDIELVASKGGITFGDTKEGSMGVRVSDEIKVKGGNGTYLNAEGKKNEKEVWGYQSDWVDYYGKVTKDGKEFEVGIAVFSHPSNKLKPCWHAREYGLLAANPFGRSKSGFPAVKENKELVTLKKGEQLKLKYAVLVHEGDTKSGEVAKHFANYSK